MGKSVKKTIWLTLSPTFDALGNVTAVGVTKTWTTNPFKRTSSTMSPSNKFPAGSITIKFELEVPQTAFGPIPVKVDLAKLEMDTTEIVAELKEWADGPS